MARRVRLISNKWRASMAVRRVSRSASQAPAATLPTPSSSSTYVLITSASMAVITMSGVMPARAKASSIWARPV
ncbi:hypothetical protein G6F59_019013 [Rhizopus arrhizus]|nr:hypothetical protein G6F59_019013 [Rhizopus arrhizus]